MKPLAMFARRVRRWRGEPGVREISRLLHELNEPRRVSSEAVDLKFVVLDPQFGQVGGVGQRLRKRFDDDDVGRRRMFLSSSAASACSASEPRPPTNAARRVAISC